MRLPDNFTFSQHSLQDFVDCPYRFYLRYVQSLQWPAVESEPALLQEARMELGQRFHALVHQYLSGIDPEILSATIDNPQLMNWWEVFLQLNIQQLPGEKLPEHLVSVESGGYRLLAKYDLLVSHSDGSHIIFDWKTSQHKPAANLLMQRMQSSVYPFVLIKYIAKISAQTIDPSVVRMQYWFPEFPTEPVEFQYSQLQYELDGEKIRSLINQTTSLSEDAWNKTDELRRCLYCQYRSLCERGVEAGYSQDEDEDLIDRDSLIFDEH